MRSARLRWWPQGHPCRRGAGPGRRDGKDHRCGAGPRRPRPARRGERSTSSGPATGSKPWSCGFARYRSTREPGCKRRAGGCVPAPSVLPGRRSAQGCVAGQAGRDRAAFRGPPGTASPPVQTARHAL